MVLSAMLHCFRGKCVLSIRGSSARGRFLAVSTLSSSSSSSSSPSLVFPSNRFIRRDEGAPQAGSKCNASGVKQGSEDWHKLRESRLTSSCFAAALGFWGTNKLVQLWEEKAGLRGQFAGNEATEWGRRHEYFAIERYREVSGNAVRSLGFKIYNEGDDLQEWLGASPDGLVDEGEGGRYERSGGILEVKCPYNNGRPELCMPWVSVPFYYMPQVQGLMEILDRDWLDMFVWTLNGSCIFRMERNPHYWALIFGVMSDFWWANVVPAKRILLYHDGAAGGEQLSAHRPTGLHRLASVVIGESKNVARRASLIWKGPPSLLGKIPLPSIPEVPDLLLAPTEDHRVLEHQIIG